MLMIDRIAVHTRLAVIAGACMTATPLLAQQPRVPPRSEGVAQVQARGSGWLLDFQDADVRVVIAALAEIGNLRVVHGDLPAKKVTLRVREAVTRQDILPLLRSIVATNDLKMSEEGSIINIAAVPLPSKPAPGDPPAETRLYVFRLRHANATRLAGVLQAIFTGGMPRIAGGLLQTPLSQGLRNQRGGRFGGQFGGQDFTTTEGQGGTAAPQQGRPAGGNQGGQQRPDVMIVPDETTNSLLIRASSGDWEIVRQAIEAVDLRPLQVLIEVMVVEVRRDEDLNVGVSAKATDNRTWPRNTQGATLRADTTADFIFNLVRRGNVDLSVAIAALQRRGNVRILSLPIIFAQNNMRSRLLVGAQRPFIQTFRTLATDNSARDQVVQYRDVGTSLTILPTINPDGYVNLQVLQEVNSATNEISFGAPVISTREAEVSMFVKDGQTLVVGGLTDTQEERTRSGIPWLSSIPGIGALFGTTRRTNTRSELFLFLTPHVVLSDEDAEHVREQVRKHSELLKQVPDGSIIMPLADSVSWRTDTMPSVPPMSNMPGTPGAPGQGAPTIRPMPPQAAPTPTPTAPIPAPSQPPSAPPPSLADTVMTPGPRRPSTP